MRLDAAIRTIILLFLYFKTPFDNFLTFCAYSCYTSVLENNKH